MKAQRNSINEITVMQSIRPAARCAACTGSELQFFTRRNNNDVYRCYSCHTLVVYPLPQGEVAIYDREYFSGAAHGHGYVDYDADKEVMRRVFLSYFSLLEQYGVARGRLLDVGAATGFFVAIAQAKGYAASGIEISDFAAAAGRKKGLAIHTGTLASVPFPKSSFEVVTLFDVIEHVQNPEADMKRVAELLVPQGLVVINTPDASSLYARLMGPRWHLIVPPEHLYCFSRAGMLALLDRVGFDVLQMTSIGKRFTIEYILHTIGRWLHVRPLVRFAKWLGWYAIGRAGLPINLRDNMFVIARKR